MNEHLPALAQEEVMDYCIRITESFSEEVSYYVRKLMKKQLARVDLQAALEKPDSILMVDDDPEIMGKYLPHLVSAARGKVSAVFYEGKGMEPLLEDIDRAASNITLMDFALKPESGKVLYGPNVIKELRRKSFNTLFVGFSGTSSADESFIESGAQAIVHKDEPVITMPRLITTLNRLVRSA